MRGQTGGLRLEIRSITKAIRLLDMLGEGNGAYGVSELARLVDMDKSSVSRMLRTLEQAGYVEQDPVTQRYSLGLNIGVLGYKALKRMDLRTAARPMLERLAEVTGECAHIAILADKRAFYIDQVAPERGVGVDAPVGTLAPLHCTALGKILLAFQPDGVREDIMQSMSYEPYTRRTMGSAEALRDHLGRVRTQGVAFDDEEYSVGVRCMASAIFRFDSSVCGAIGVSGPSPRISDGRISEWEPMLLETSKELSKRLGWDGVSPPVFAGIRETKAEAVRKSKGQTVA
jgi:DNA-binding IclR family transcriptional regulator